MGSLSVFLLLLLFILFSLFFSFLVFSFEKKKKKKSYNSNFQVGFVFSVFLGACNKGSSPGRIGECGIPGKCPPSRVSYIEMLGGGCLSQSGLTRRY